MSSLSQDRLLRSDIRHIWRSARVECCVTLQGIVGDYTVASRRSTECRKCHPDPFLNRHDLHFDSTGLRLSLSYYHNLEFLTWAFHNTTRTHDCTSRARYKQSRQPHSLSTMSTTTFSQPPPTAAFNASPVVHNIYSDSTETWQYIIADPTTGHCIVLDPVRDRCADHAAMATKAADAIVNLVEQKNYVVDYILETHAFESQCLSAAWYLRMQFSIYQGWPPQLCNEATVSSLKVAWQRKYGAGSTFSTTVRASLDNGESVTLGWLSLTSMRMPGFGSPHRRAYLVGKDLFGANSIATLAEDVFDESASNYELSRRSQGENVSFLESWTSMQRILALPGDTRVWWERGVVSGEALPCDSLSQCMTSNKHARSTESDFLAGIRESYIQRLSVITQPMPRAVGWKTRLGRVFSVE
jgi:hypothetical protein